MEKESNPFYHSRAWKAVRTQALVRDGGMCRDCMELFDAGIIRKPNRATMVHHMETVEERPDRALDLTNLRSLCDSCHNKRHPEKGAKDKVEPVCRGLRIIKV